MARRPFQASRRQSPYGPVPERLPLSVPPGMVWIIHDIDWAPMKHAYGTAEEVPALLRALRSPDDEERHKALDRFYGAVHHQGSVYPPTADLGEHRYSGYR